MHEGSAGHVDSHLVSRASALLVVSVETKGDLAGWQAGRRGGEGHVVVGLSEVGDIPRGARPVVHDVPACCQMLFPFQFEPGGCFESQPQGPERRTSIAGTWTVSGAVMYGRPYRRRNCLEDGITAHVWCRAKSPVKIQSQSVTPSQARRAIILGYKQRQERRSTVDLGDHLTVGVDHPRHSIDTLCSKN